MKKFLMALLLMVPVSAYAFSIGVVNDITASTNGASLAWDQNGNSFTASGNGLSFSTSDTTRIGVAYNTPLIWGLSGGTSWEYTSDNDHVLGLDTSFDYWGANLDATVGWNLNEMDFDGTLGTGYTAFGLDGSITSNWDIDRFSYEGVDVTGGYTWAISDEFSVRPNVTVPFDGGFGLGDITAGVSISIQFGSTPSE